MPEKTVAPILQSTPAKPGVRKVEAHGRLRLELMQARTELAFLLSDQVCVQTSEVRNVRQRINKLLEAINGGSPLGASNGDSALLETQQASRRWHSPVGVRR